MTDAEPTYLSEAEAATLTEDHEHHSPQEVLEWALERFGPRQFAVFTSFQIDGSVLIDMAWRLEPKIRVITIDTGRMPAEQFEIIDAFKLRYGIHTEVFFPSSADIEPMVQRGGVNLFYDSVKNRMLCCQVRKVLPQLRALKTLSCWATGLRRDQTATRSQVQKVALDMDHGGIVKLAPLACWTEDQVWAYAREHDVPVHPLYHKGFTSLGCQPCTRPVEPGEHARAGRWWWESNAPKECGMHCSLESGSFERQAVSVLGHAGSESLVALTAR